MVTPPTLEDVARLAGVSRATVSRVVRGAGPSSPAAKAAVESAIESLGYVPNLAARSLVTKRSDVIALVVPESNQRIFTDPFFGSAIGGMVDALSATTKQLVLAMRSAQDGGESLRRYLAQSQMDGVVILSHHASDDFAEVLLQRGVPMVFVGRPPDGRDVPYVDLDNFEGGRLAARHLMDRGARRLATICGPQDMAAARDRLEGWRSELSERGLEEVACYHGDFTGPRAAELTRQLMAAHEVDGLFVASDPMALASVAAIRGMGKSVPGDVRVVGFDDTVAGGEASPTLTTITNPARLLAATATNRLLGALEGEEPGGAEIIQPELVVRESS